MVFSASEQLIDKFEGLPSIGFLQSEFRARRIYYIVRLADLFGRIETK
jgi:hypothetical protein